MKASYDATSLINIDIFQGQKKIYVSSGEYITHIEVFSSKGFTICHNKVNSNKTVLDVGTLANGIYLLKTFTKNSLIKRLICIE